MSDRQWTEWSEPVAFKTEDGAEYEMRSRFDVTPPRRWSIWKRIRFWFWWRFQR